MINVFQASNNFWKDEIFEILDTSGLVAEDLAEHIAVGASTFCISNNIRYVKRSDLTFLAARGLFSLDLLDESLTLLKKDSQYQKKSSAWIDNFGFVEQFSELFPFFSRGIIYPDKWVGSNAGVMWVLDFEQLEINENEFHEIMIYRSLHTLLDLMIPMWKITYGKGVLGLRGLNVNILKKLFPSKKFSHADELVLFTRDIVQQKKEEYNWKYSPEIIII